MRHTRLLIAVPAAAGLVFTGLAPAAANSSDDGRNGHTSARVLTIDDEADANGRGTRVEVTFDYRCRGDDDDITTKVTLRQGNARFSTEFEDRLACNGRSHEKTVVLRDSGKRLHNDDARVTVRFKDGKTLSEKSRRVEVEGVNRGDRK
jgi:hypothetical protein